MVSMVLPELIDGIPDEIVVLRAALARSDKEAVVRSAHTVKGLADSACCEPAREVAQSIELSARAGELASATASLPMLDAEIARFQTAARSWLARQSA